MVRNRSHHARMTVDRIALRRFTQWLPFLVLVAICVVGWSPLGVVVGFGLTWSMFQHMGSGIRHFIMDSGEGFDLVTSRRMALAMRWVIESARKRGENTMPRKLAAELLEASESRGGAVKKREETHRMAEANKAFSHYRW